MAIGRALGGREKPALIIGFEKELSAVCCKMGQMRNVLCEKLCVVISWLINAVQTV